MTYLRKSTRIAIYLCALIALTFNPALSTQITKQLAPGVTLFQDINTDPASALIVNVVTVDLNNPTVKVKAALAKDTVYDNDSTKGREKVSTLTSRRGALVGINADFFPFTGDPLGMCIIDGELISEPAKEGRAAFALTKNGAIFFDKPVLSAKLTLASNVSRQVDGINRGRETNQVIVYTEAFGSSTQTKYKGTDIVLTSDELPIRVGKTVNMTVTEVKPDSVNTQIPRGGVVISAGGPAGWFLKENLKPGDRMSVQFDIKGSDGQDWTQVDQAVGGGPWLVKDGNEFIDTVQECFQPSFCTTSHPRTAVGMTSDNKLLLVTVDGRQAISGGLSLPNMAALMKRYNAVNAINLDGGGSTTLSIKGLVANSPSEGAERPVANALLVFSDQPALQELSDLVISGIPGDVVSGEGAQLFLTWGDESQMLTEGQLDSIIWGTTNGVGFVNQKGYFTPVKTRKGTVNALYGAQAASLAVNVIEKAPVQEEILPVEPILQEPVLTQ